MATVLIIGTFDTKGPECQYLRERIEAHGCKVLALDSGILGEAEGITPEFTRQMVAVAAGYTIEQLRNAGSRGKAVEGMLKGVRKLAQQLYAEKKIHGLVSLGGMEHLTAKRTTSSDLHSAARSAARVARIGLRTGETLTFTATADAAPGSVRASLHLEASRPTAADVLKLLGL